MHLGYHELRNMLKTFREEREKRKTAPPPMSAPGNAAPGGPRPSGGEHRSSRDDYRDRDRAPSTRHEYVDTFIFTLSHLTSFVLQRSSTKRAVKIAWAAEILILICFLMYHLLSLMLYLMQDEELLMIQCELIKYVQDR